MGPGKTYAKPCAAFAAAQDGDGIEIDAAGSYDGDVCVITKSRLTIQGVNGRPHIDAAGKNAAGKAIWVIQGDQTKIYDIELSGCAVPDQNGAGIRQEGRDLYVEDCYFHDNENGILTGANPNSTIVIKNSEFARNGAGDGQSHNMYIGEVGRFTLQGSYSHHGKVGHLVKSRALRNDILYNRLTDETGNASYELDLPQGGPSRVIGNLFQKSADAGNGGFISFARESTRNANTALFVVNNTFVNQRSAGTFVAVAKDVKAVVLRNNIFAGSGTPTDAVGATSEGNFAGDPKFVNAAQYDYALQADSPALSGAVDPGSDGDRPLHPTCHYEHPAHAQQRQTYGSTYQGALERGYRGPSACGVAYEPPNDPPEPVDAGAVLDAGVTGGVDARVADAAVTIEGDAKVGGPVEVHDASASEPTKKDDGCQGAGVGAQLWSVALALLLGLRRRRYAVR
ncbi:MAG: hypothetical protein ABW352_15785 [Polyangiales bacterium]